MMPKVITRSVRAVASTRGFAALLSILLIFAALLASQWFLSAPALGDNVPPGRPLASLKTASVPRPSNLNDFVRNEAAAVQLGKALFWDMQVGTDGATACATCHFQAGRDGRTKNTLHPGSSGFDVGGPNATLTLANFPIASDDRVGSQGVHRATFVDIVPGSAVDQVISEPDSVFHVGAASVRQSTGRQAPSIINAIFNFDNFWDGRAEFDFNGVNPFGARDPNARVLQVQGDGSLQPVRVSIDNASLASQAVGPPNNSVEMAAAGRTFPQLGRKMLSLTPLGKQQVHPQDSVLSVLASPAGPGLTRSYADLIRDAFQPQWWDSGQTVNGFSVIENNFSLYWGLAIQLYESTLVSDDSPVDRFLDGDSSALSPTAQLGMEVFQRDDGLCIQCHGGPELTNASVASMSGQLLQLMTMGDDRPAVIDNGFFNIGVRPTGEDLGVGGFDPFGNPLSRSRLSQVGGRVAVDGAVKTPSLRNVDLTFPYFRNGSRATLSQVLDFYDPIRGEFADANIANLAPHIDRIRLNDQEKTALLAFMRALTDDRVRFERAPFDHPQLFVPNGALGDTGVVAQDVSGTAVDDLLEIPATGNGGGPPLPPAPEPPAPNPPGPDRSGPNPGPSGITSASSSSSSTSGTSTSGPNAARSSTSSTSPSGSAFSGSRTATSGSPWNTSISSGDLSSDGSTPGSSESPGSSGGSGGSDGGVLPTVVPGLGQTSRLMSIAGLGLVGSVLAMAIGAGVSRVQESLGLGKGPTKEARNRSRRSPDSPERKGD